MLGLLIRVVMLSLVLVTIGCATDALPKPTPPSKTIVPDTSPSAHKAGNPGS